MGLNHFEKKYKKVPIKIGMAIAIGFVFLIFFILGGLEFHGHLLRRFERLALSCGVMVPRFSSNLVQYKPPQIISRPFTALLGPFYSPFRPLKG